MSKTTREAWITFGPAVLIAIGCVIAAAAGLVWF